jgi:integrase
MDVYTRHIRAFYRWAVEFDYLISDPSRRLVKVKPRATVPHPTKPEDLRLILARDQGPLRTAYVLAAFAGLRCGEICRLRWEDIDLDGDQPTALIDGKGDKQRRVPLLPPVLDELRKQAPTRRGYVVTYKGVPFEPLRLSHDSGIFLRLDMGLATTLHSMRAAFATAAAKTTEIYMASSMEDAHVRLSALTDAATAMLEPA